MSIFHGKTILVTGATGLIGENLVNECMAYPDVKVIAVVRSVEKLTQCFSKYLHNKRFSYVVQDIVEPLSINERVDYLFHAAGPIAGNVIRDKPLQVIAPNLLGTKNCLEFLCNQQKNGHSGRMIIFSSATVYGDQTGVVNESMTDVAESLSGETIAYSESKRMAEVLARSYWKQYQLDVVIVRLSYIYGCAHVFPQTALFRFIDIALAGEEIRLLNPLAMRRDYLYVRDAVKGIILVAQNGESGEAYNVSSFAEKKNYVSMDELAREIVSIAQEVFGQSSSLVLPELGMNRTEGILLDNKKIKNLGWKVSVSLNVGLRKTMQKRWGNKKEK